MADYAPHDKSWTLARDADGNPYPTQATWAAENGHTIGGRPPGFGSDCPYVEPPSAKARRQAMQGVTPRRRNIAREAELQTVAGPHGHVPVVQQALGAPTHDGLFYYGEGFTPRCTDEDAALWERWLAVEEIKVSTSERALCGVTVTFVADPALFVPFVSWEV